MLWVRAIGPSRRRRFTIPSDHLRCAQSKLHACPRRGADVAYLIRFPATAFLLVETNRFALALVT